MRPQNQSIVAFFLSIFLLPLFTLGEKFNVPGAGDLDEEVSTDGSTWTGQLLLPEKFKSSPEVYHCEFLASQIYKALLSLDDDDRVMGPKTADVAVSVYTYPKSDYYWVSTIPRGTGLATAKSRISRDAPILRRRLRPLPPSTAGVTHRVHAEEGAFSLFEQSQVYPFEAGAETYPPGSVVGTWNMYKAKNRKVGKKRAPCEVDSVLDKNALKNNRACEIVTEELHVTVRAVDGTIRNSPASSSGTGNHGTTTHPAEGQGTKRPVSPGSSDDDHKRPKNDPGEGPSNCARGLIPHKQGTVVACRLPTAKHTSKGRPTTLRTVHTAAAGTKTGKTKPTATGAARQRPTNTRLAKTKATTALRQKPTGTRPAKVRSTVAGHQKPASTRPGRPAKTTKAAAARTGRPKTQKKPA